MTRPPLVLLHGVTMSGAAWRDVVPLLDREFTVYTPTAAGHRGGPLAQRPASIATTIDAAERYLDEHGLDRPHLAGNSMGGWMAIELARRGRASSVCALSPAGLWSIGEESQTGPTGRVRRSVVASRIPRLVASVGLRLPVIRRLVFGEVAEHGDRITRAQGLEAIDDVRGCSVAMELLAVTDQVAPLDPLPCPVTVAWSERDQVFPVAINGTIARERLPQAVFEVLPGVGHVPMIDDPRLVADVVRRSVHWPR